MRGTRRSPAALRRSVGRRSDDTDCDEDDERDVGGEQEAQEFLDVVVDATPFFHGGGDGGEVVVEQDEVGDFA